MIKNKNKNQNNNININFSSNQSGNINNLENSLMNNKYNRNPIMQSNDNLIHLDEKSVNVCETSSLDKSTLNILENQNDKMCIDTGIYY